MFSNHYFKTYKSDLCCFSAEGNTEAQVFVAICQNTQHSTARTLHHRRTPHWGPDLAKTSHAFRHYFSVAPAHHWSQDGLCHGRTWELTFLSSNHSLLRNVCSKAAIKCFTKARYLAVNSSTASTSTSLDKTEEPIISTDLCQIRKEEEMQNWLEAFQSGTTESSGNLSWNFLTQLRVTYKHLIIFQGIW